MEYNRIIISDLHLGSKACNAKAIIEFLENNTAPSLILNGDVIDGWSIKRGAKWKNSYTKVVRKLLKLSENKVDIIWVKGNHDDFVKEFVPFELSGIKIVNDYTFTDMKSRKCFVFHGDILDFFITKAKWISVIGSIGYDIILWINKIYNFYRKLRGLRYYSLSKEINMSIKKALEFVNKFKDNAIILARKKGCEVAICGHLHCPELSEYYMNSGDCCESCTALVETMVGEWKIINF